MKNIERRGKRSFRISYTDQNGQLQRETIKGDTPEEAIEEAKRQLTIRKGDLARGLPITSKPNTVTFAELCADVVNNYEANGLSSKDDIEARYRLHLIPFFGMSRRAAEITTADFSRYIVHRNREQAAAGTVCRELEAARRAYLLAKRATPPKVHLVPHIPMLKQTNVRQGFYERTQLDAICRHLPDYLVPVARFAYITGWRLQEVLSRCWRHVHSEGVRLEPGETKNKKGRMFPMVAELKELLESIRPSHTVFPNTPLFSREGEAIRSFYKAWATAARKAGLPVVYTPLQRAVRDDEGKICRDVKGRPILQPVLYKRGPKKGQPMKTCRAAVLFHDFRRTAYRNLVLIDRKSVV